MALAAATLAGSLIGAGASKKAGSQQASAQRDAIATQKEFLAPFQQAGTNALGDLQSFVNQGSNFSDTQAFKDITNAARASGQFGSGNRATALTDFFATNFRPQRLNELSVLPRIGANAAGSLASNIGGLQQNIGAANARGTIGFANNISSGIGSFADLLKKSNINSFNDSISTKG